MRKNALAKDIFPLLQAQTKYKRNSKNRYIKQKSRKGNEKSKNAKKVKISNIKINKRGQK